jgi:hypothetical protein
MAVGKNQPAGGRADHVEPAGHRTDCLRAAAGAGGARGRGARGRPLRLLQPSAKIYEYVLLLDCTENMNDDREDSTLNLAGRSWKM